MYYNRKISEAIHDDSKDSCNYELQEATIRLLKTLDNKQLTVQEAKNLFKKTWRDAFMSLKNSIDSACNADDIAVLIKSEIHLYCPDLVIGSKDQAAMKAINEQGRSLSSFIG